MPTTPTAPPSADPSATLVEFARACRTAARSVALYPATHPAIRGALGRVASSAERLATSTQLSITVLPDQLAVEGRASSRADAAIQELAGLLHERLVGTLTISQGADEADWHALLLLLSRPPEDLLAQGGIARAWAATGRTRFEIREIDYAEVLRERPGGHTAEWDRIIACCLQGDASSLDQRAVETLLDALGDPERFGDLLDRFEHASAASGASIGARTAALLQLLRSALESATAGGDVPEAAERALDVMAAAAARLTPEMMLALLASRQSQDQSDAALATGLVSHLTGTKVASFVARSVTAARGATERLAQAFEALVSEGDSKARLLAEAYEEARQTEVGREDGFDELWQAAAEMLTSYSDATFVSEDYGRELSGARAHAIEVERVADDPPDRMQAWIATVSDDAIRQLDLELLLDLMRIESDPARWEVVSGVAAREIERRTVLGELEAAQRLVEGIVRELEEGGRPGLGEPARAVANAMATPQMLRHIVLHLRRADDEKVDALNRLCHTMGPVVIRPLAEALATEDDRRTIARIRELLLGFGAAARPSVEPLRNSTNPAVRRTAIELLRVLGGDDALPELAPMLHDGDPQVQSESIRAIVEIGTPKACAILERELAANTPVRDLIIREILGRRDKKVIPLLCYILQHTRARGSFAQVHAGVIEALGGLSAHPDSIRALREALHRGDWWAPGRTAALRKAAATSLRRLGSPEAIAVLQEAAAAGTRRVRNAARPQAELAARLDKERA